VPTWTRGPAVKLSRIRLATDDPYTYGCGIWLAYGAASDGSKDAPARSVAATIRDITGPDANDLLRYSMA
jgi:hypothetical protein